MVAHPHLVLLTVQVVKHLVVGVLMVIVNTRLTNIVVLVQGSWFHYIEAIISLVITVTVGCIVLVCIYLILLRLPSSCIVKHCAILARWVIVVDATHFKLSRVLEC